jgi:hypothetical protein
MCTQELRRQLYDSFKNRAVIYHLIFDELREQVGAEKAEQILGNAIYKRGTQKGHKYSAFAPGDLKGLEKAFVGGIPDGGAMFRPEVMRSDSDGLDIKFNTCPLREAWQEMGLEDEEVATICRIAARVDNGTFESAGFKFSADTWKPGGDGCCYLHIRPGE